MPSEKSRYIKKVPKRQGISWSWDELPAILHKVPVESLTALLMHGAESSSPLRRTLLIHAAYAAFDGQSSHVLEANL